jgi:hypothetical protein
MTNREFLSPLKLTSIRAMEYNHKQIEDAQTEHSSNVFSQTVR